MTNDWPLFAMLGMSAIFEKKGKTKKMLKMGQIFKNLGKHVQKLKIF